MLASCEFKSQVVGELRIPSTWKKETVSKDAEAQTSKLKTTSCEAQTDVSCLQASEQLDKGVGTEKAQYQASLQGLQYVYNNINYDEANLAKFLEETKDEVLAILHKNARSTIFTNYTPNWTQKNSELSPLYSLSSPKALDGGLHALSISWNCSGTMVAVAYGRIDISGWCYEKGYVCVWNLARPDLDERMPHYTLETETYATCVTFHPTQASALAVGTYSGEVILSPNITDNIPTEYSSNKAETKHMQPITSMQWVSNLQELRPDHRYILCSAGQSGLLIYWSLLNKMVKPLAAFSVASRRHLVSGVAALCHGSTSIGRGSAMPSVDAVLLVGLENGEIGRGRTGMIPTEVDANTPTQVIPLELDWMDGHRGPIQSISTSPFLRHLLMSCSSDGYAHLYSDLERAPLLSLAPSADPKHFLYDAQFSPFRPSVVAVASRSSSLHLYDLQADQSKPAYSVSAGTEGAPLVSLMFNSSASDWLATGDARGYVRVWRLPSEVTQPTELERAALRSDQQPDGAEKGTGMERNAVRDLLGFVL